MPVSPLSAASTGPVLYLRVGRNLRGRDIIVGDVHGAFDELRAALAEIDFNPGAGDRLFFVGDLVDRGRQSYEALGWLSRPYVFCVRGNHEQMAIDHVSGLSDAGMYIANGGAWFLALTRPEQRQYADAFASLPLAIELETEEGLVGIVHAECPTPTFARLEQEFAGVRAEGVAMCCIWSRTRIECCHTDHIEDVRAVVVGHTPQLNWTSLGNHIYIDTMGWRGRSFTLLDAATLRPVRNTIKKDAATV